MKTRLLSLAVLLMAGAAQGALAQDQDHQGRGEWRQGGGRGGAQPGVQGGPPGHPAVPNPPQAQVGRPGWGSPMGRPWPGAQAQAPQAQTPQAAPQAPAAPPAPSAPRFERRPEGGGHRDWRGGERRGERAPQGQPPGVQSFQRPNEPGWRGDRDRRDDDRREERRFQDRGPGVGDRRDWNGGRPGVSPQDWRDRDRDRDHDGDRRGWNGGPERRDRGGREAWAPHRYPPIYRSPQRYRGPVWRPPSGYYARVWRFGEFLPRGWFAPDYWVGEWWAYGLPEPPPGYEWVRVGYDALLVDEYDGRVVQVVRYVFW